MTTKSKPKPVVTEVAVTVQEGKVGRRYIVVEEDERYFEGVTPGKVAGGVKETAHNVVPVREAREDALGRFHFGAIAKQGSNRGCYRILGTWEVMAVAVTYSEHPELYAPVDERN